jgi:hypothetical protein
MHNPSAKTDICWAEFPENVGDALDLEDTSLVDPTQVTVVFRQPFNDMGEWVGPQSQLGATDAVLYKISSDTLLEDGIKHVDLLESIDIGFRGMSGAMAIADTGKCVGMFVKRGATGALIPLKNKDEKKENIDEDTKPVSTEDKLLEYSWFERMFLPGLCSKIEKMDAKMESMSADMKVLLAQMDQTLKKEDLRELGAVFDARRGIFLPSTAIISAIEDAHSTNLTNFIGTDAPDNIPLS